MARISSFKSGDYLKDTDLFFDSSKLLFSQITNVFDFAWPMVAGMWNLRWQVNGYINANPNSTVNDLNERFSKGSGGDRANLIRACQDFTWNEQKEQFAIFLLVNAFAFYESWIVNILKELGYASKDVKTLEKMFQKWDDKKGVWEVYKAISDITKNYSNDMYDLFYYKYSSHKKNAFRNLDNLMICYKCFKEIRNCVMHRGSIVDKMAFDAYNRYSALSPHDLKSKEIPFANPLVMDEKVKIDLRGVVGFL